MLSLSVNSLLSLLLFSLSTCLSSQLLRLGGILPPFVRLVRTSSHYLPSYTLSMLD